MQSGLHWHEARALGSGLIAEPEGDGCCDTDGGEEGVCAAVVTLVDAPNDYNEWCVRRAEVGGIFVVSPDVVWAKMWQPVMLDGVQIGEDSAPAPFSTLITGGLRFRACPLSR